MCEQLEGKSILDIYCKLRICLCILLSVALRIGKRHLPQFADMNTK